MCHEEKIVSGEKTTKISKEITLKPSGKKSQGIPSLMIYRNKFADFFGFLLK